MTRQEALKRFNKSSWIRQMLKIAAVGTRNPGRAVLAELSAGEEAIEVLRTLGFIESARLHAERHKASIPMGGWVATESGINELAERDSQ
jgi:hypothetical protein